MGVLYTRPSGKSELRQTRSPVVLAALLGAAFCTILPSIANAKPSPQPRAKARTSVAKPAATKQQKTNQIGKPQTTKSSKSGKIIKQAKKQDSKRPARVARPVSRTTKVDRSKPVKRSVAAKSSPKRAAAASRKAAQRVAVARSLSEDPWQRAIEMDRAKSARWSGSQPRERIVLPNLFGADEQKSAEVLDVATGLLGRPYRFGARGHAFDCSGFTAEVFEKVGVELPHSARDQFVIGDRVPRDDLEPGDLVFFHTYRKGASHVGIYMGEDKFIHAASKIGVKISSLNEMYYSARFLGARRLEL